MYNFRENWFPTQAGSAAATAARRKSAKYSLLSLKSVNLKQNYSKKKKVNIFLGSCLCF